MSHRGQLRTTESGRIRQSGQESEAGNGQGWAGRKACRERGF